MTAPAVQARDEAGLWQPGPTGLIGNPEGKNQFSPGFTRRRIDAAIDLQSAARPECITSFAESFLNALKDPHAGKNMALLYLMKDRIAGLLPSEQSADLRAEETSEEQWRSIASDIRVEASHADAVTDAEVVAEPDEGAP